METMTVIITFQIDYHRASELLMVYLEFRIYILIMIYSNFSNNSDSYT